MCPVTLEDQHLKKELVDLIFEKSVINKITS